MQQFQNAETTTDRRHLYFHAVDATDGITAETGLTGVGRLSKNGATTAATSASITEIDSTNMPGRYYVVLTTTELNADGMIEFRYKAAACAEVVIRAQVVPWDPYDVTRMGLTALPNAAAQAAGGLYTRGTGAGQINQPADGQINVNVVGLQAFVIGSGAFAGGAIDASALAADCITAAKIADNAIAAEHIASAAITNAKLAANCISDTKIATGAINSAKFALSAINAAAIATDAIGSLELAASAVNKIRDAILDEATASHVGAGSVGEVLDNLPNDGALTFLDASVAGNATPAEVLTQVNAALDTAISELSVGVPAATPTLRTGLMLLYMAIRNKLEVFTSAADEFRVFDDGGTEIATKALTDSGGDYTEAKMISG